MTEPLVAKGAASEVEVLRLRREANDLQNKMNDARNQYYVKAREELSKANTDTKLNNKLSWAVMTVYNVPYLKHLCAVW
jgi:adhesin transport system membrane fusion protein